MTNNLNVSEGTGKVVATDDVSGAHIQLVKLADGAEDSAARIGGDASNGLDVDVTRVVPGTSATNLGKAIDSAAGGTDTGVAVLAIRDDTLSALTPVDGDYSALRVDANGRLYVNLDMSGATITANTQATTSGGATPVSYVSASGNNATTVKASAGQVYGYYAYNANAAVMFVKLYDKASNPAPASDSALLRYVIAIPPGAAANLNFGSGMAFTSGIAFAMVTGIAAANNTGVAASEIVFSVLYK